MGIQLAMGLADLDGIAVPRELVLRGPRPVRGQLVRVGLATTGLLLGLSLPIPVGAAIVLITVGGAWVAPRIVDRFLRRIEDAHDSVIPADARRKMAELERPWWVATFAPHAWVALQRAHLQLVGRMPKDAAATLSECARMIGDPTHPVLVEAQAHVLLLADDRRAVAQCLTPLAERDRLTPRGRLDFGIALLSMPGRHLEALRHLESAREGIGNHPRVSAALAAALARGGQADSAEQMLASLPRSDDPLTADLVRRARKRVRGRPVAGIKTTDATKAPRLGSPP